MVTVEGTIESWLPEASHWPLFWYTNGSLTAALPLRVWSVSVPPHSPRAIALSAGARRFQSVVAYRSASRSRHELEAVSHSACTAPPGAISSPRISMLGRF